MKPWHMGTHQECSARAINEYQHDRVKMVFKIVCFLVLWMKVASALEGLNINGLTVLANQSK